ncbi:MAG: hypothetical protein Q8N88_00585 [Nanoarchaeota archaeon]|nr:hypothetical protein [Nanoarchaeota archaeon]
MNYSNFLMDKKFAIPQAFLFNWKQYFHLKSGPLKIVGIILIVIGATKIFINIISDNYSSVLRYLRTSWSINDGKNKITGKEVHD